MNPYLKEKRLADVIAAITTLGTYKFYKLDVDHWADRIGGAHMPAAHWQVLFEEHPEFFRLTFDKKRVSLVWRRQFPRNFLVDAEPEVSPDDKIDGSSEDRVSRRPLSPTELTELIGVAIRLHDRALEQKKASGWWIPLVAAGLSFVGALLGGLVGS